MIDNKYYLFGSWLLTIVVVFHTYVNEEHFYATVIHAAKSKSILLILFNFGIVNCVLFFKMLIWIFFGNLKQAEAQHFQSHAIHHGLQLVIVLYMLSIEFD